MARVSLKYEWMIFLKKLCSMGRIQFYERSEVLEPNEKLDDIAKFLKVKNHI